MCYYKKYIEDLTTRLEIKMYYNIHNYKLHFTVRFYKIKLNLKKKSFLPTHPII